MIQLVTETVTSRIFSAFCVGGNTSGCIYNDIPDSTFQCLLDSSLCQAVVLEVDLLPGVQ